MVKLTPKDTQDYNGAGTLEREAVGWIGAAARAEERTQGNELVEDLKNARAMQGLVVILCRRSAAATRWRSKAPRVSVRIRAGVVSWLRAPFASRGAEEVA